jgi:Lon protease-like protein
MISPYGPEEKQALLEAPDLRSRSEILMALAEMEIAAPDSGTGSSLH